MSDLVSVPGRAVKVTLFEDRAEVARAARVALRAGSQWVAIGGVTPFVDERTVQARVSGGARVIAARIRRRVHHEPALGREEIDALEQRARDARRRLDACALRVERLERDVERLSQLFQRWTALAASARRFVADPPRLASWRASYDELGRALGAAHAALGAARAETTRAGDERQRAELRLAEAQIVQPRWETSVEVQLDAPAAGEHELQVGYRTPCALWRPEHLARLSRRDDGARIELVTYAVAWQCTGEAWSDVELVFSTARTGRAASPPLVLDDRLATRRKTEEQQKRVVVEAREQAVAVAGLDRGARAVDEMPGVEDGGEPLWFAPSGRASLASDGRPFRVEIARRTLSAETALVLYPERAAAAHLRATATLRGGGPLLAGPVRVARDQVLVGRSKTDFVGEGEPFELGFGVDGAVRVRRTQDDERDTTAITGTQKLKRTVKVYLSNLSGERRRVEVTERVPVSEIDDVQVTAPSAPWRFDAKDGFARREIELGARATETLTLSYEVRAAAKVTLPF